MTTATGPDSLAAQRVRLAAVTDEPVDVEVVRAAVLTPEAGAVVVFTGEVRDHDGGRGVRVLTYEAHPTATDVAARVAAEVAERTGALALAVVHRTGRLLVGETAVVAAASAAHRDAAFEAARLLIDETKSRVPIWKLQEFADGSTEWVACHG